MDRDQVNCIHYLYQGDPAPELSMDRLFGFDGDTELVWCGPDTMHPMLGQGMIEEQGGEIVAHPAFLGFVDAVEQQLRSLPKPDFLFGYPISAPIRKQGELRPAFLAIPYAPEFDAIKAAVLDTARQADFECEVTGDLGTPGPIMDQVWQGIRGADVVIADITGTNANVMIEVGMAAALGKEVIVVTQDQTLPFDLQHWRTQFYDANDLNGLRKDLLAGFRGVSARYPFEGDEPRF